MFRKIINIGGFLLLAVFVVVTLAFTSLEYKNAACRSIEVNYAKDDAIHVDKGEIISLIKKADKNILGKKFSQINSDSIEAAIEQHDAILQADVYKMVTAQDSFSYRGVLAVRVKHRKPVVRIISNKGSYYLDEFGGKIPTSKNYTANVLVATGNINEEYAQKKLLPCVLYMENDDFWEAQIEQVHVKENVEVVLTPLVGDLFIELGKIDNYAEKLRNMKTFYKDVLAKDNWNKYKSVSLKFKNQVIAKRR